MPIYHLRDVDNTVNVAVEAKSENAARVYMTRHLMCSVVSAQELATLVMDDGIKVESANADKARDANQAALRG